MARLITLAVIAAAGGDRYHASEVYCTRNADTPANTLFSGRLIDAVYERAVTFPIWSRVGGEQAISFVELVNTDGALDSWAAEDWKDVRITLLVVEARAAYSSAVQVGVCVVDRLEFPTSTTARFVCRSAYERLEKTITTNYGTGITNEALRGKPKPLTIGRVRWMDPANHTLNDSAGSARGIHDVNDGYFQEITELRHRGALQTESENPLVTNSSPQYFVVQDANGYGFRFRDQSYRLGAEVKGAIRRGSTLITNSTFPTASGVYPTGFDVVEGGSGSVVWNSAGSVTITGDGTAETYISQDVSITTGAVYQISVGVTSLTGVLALMNADIIPTLYNVRAVENATGYTVVASFVGDAARETMVVGFKTGASGTAQISSFDVYPAYPVSSLAELVRFCAVERGSLTTADIDSSALAAIDTAAGYAIGWHNQGVEVRGIDLVRLAAQSFGVALYQDASGVLAPVQIDEPAVSADFTLDEFDILSISFETDEAPGLSAKMHYGRNYSQHSADDVAGISPSTVAAVLLRQELQADVRSVTTTETLDAIYADANSRDPLDSILSEQADAQAEIDRLCALYTQPRAFYTLKAFVGSGTAYTIEPGDTVSVTHSRYGLSGGVNLLVVTARSDFVGAAVDLVLWG